MSAGNQNGVASKDFLKRVAEGSGNVDDSGNFSIEVLRSALLNKFELTLANTLQESVKDIEITKFDGFICNRQSHWFAIRKINGRFWNLNSTKEKPEPISHFRLAAEIEALRREGYSVFCVVEIGSLPPPCSNENELKVRGAQEFWWKESHLIQGTGRRGYADAWESVGSGMRLDGRSTAVTSGSGATFGSAHQMGLEGLTEDEMLQMALAASMQEEENLGLGANREQQQNASDVNFNNIEVPPEPAAGAEGSVRIQFRLPDGKRTMRRFLKDDLIQVLVAFVRKSCPDASRKLELRAGFPPKDILPRFSETIESANLSGESIQCRYY